MATRSPREAGRLTRKRTAAPLRRSRTRYAAARVTPTRDNAPLGLIAGEGVFPFLVARGARAAGRRVVCVGFDGIADPALASEVDAYRPVSFVRLTSWARFLRRHGASEAIMVGRVKKQAMHVKHEWLWALRQVPDWTTFWAWATVLRRDRRSETVLLKTAQLLQDRGITLIDSTAYTREQMASAGTMGSVQPTEAQQRSIDRGWRVCGLLTAEDVGQAVAVRDRDVIAVEATEGTNAMIDRAGQLCRGGRWTLVKRGNTRHDPRMDVPTIGVGTIEHLHAAGGACLCLEAGQVILLERDKVLAMADRLGIAVVGRAGE